MNLPPYPYNNTNAQQLSVQLHLTLNIRFKGTSISLLTYVRQLQSPASLIIVSHTSILITAPASRSTTSCYKQRLCITRRDAHYMREQEIFPLAAQNFLSRHF